MFGRGKEPKKVKKNLFVFLRRLLLFAQSEGVLLDGTLIPQVQAWLISMTTSNWRTMRHTATLIALHVVHCFSEIGYNLDKAVHQLDIQIDKVRESERQKKGKQLRDQRAKLEDERDAIDECLQDFHDK